MLCQREEREAGRAYPRTCPTCKMGPCQKFGATPLQTLADAKAEIARLTAALEMAISDNQVKASQIELHSGMAETARSDRATARAEVAMAFEVAADWLMTVPEKLPNRDQYAKHIRALTPSDAKAALAARDRATRERALRDAADAVSELCAHADIPGGNCIPDKFDEGTSAASAAILAMIEMEGK